MAEQTKKPGRAISVALACALPILLFAVAFFYLRGDLGRYYDDWVFAGRDPVSGTTDWHGFPWRHAPYFWRPLLFPFLYYSLAILWDHHWIFHVFNVLSHGCVCYFLWRLLRRLTATPQAALGGVIVFAFYPLHFDVVFWSTAITSSIPAAFVLPLCELYIRYARGGSWRLVIPMALLAFFVTCWYEQPITLVPALPCLYFAVCPADEPWRKRIGRSFGAAAAIGAVLLLYIALMVATVPKGIRGGASSIVSLNELWPRFRFVAKQVFSLGTTKLWQWELGSFRLGWDALHWKRGVASVFMAGAVSVSWVRWFTRAEGTFADHGRASRPWVLLFAALWWFLCWLPFVPIRDQWVTPRCFYVPMLAAGIVAAVCIDALLTKARSARARTGAAGTVGVLLGVFAMASTVCLVGWQIYYQARALADDTQIRDLMERVPNPPAKAVLVCLEDTSTPVVSGKYLADHQLVSWVATTTGIAKIRHFYQRRDVYLTNRSPWNALPLTSVTPQTFSYHIAFGGYPVIDGKVRIPWDKSIPFCIDSQGRIVLVDRLIFRNWKGEDVVVAPEPIKAANPGPTREFVLPESVLATADSR